MSVRATAMQWGLADAQWALLAADLGHECYPPPIRVGALRGQRAFAQARDELAAAGLLRAGRIDADLEEVLRLLHRPTLWFDSLWLPEAGRDAVARLIVAANDRVGVSATQHPALPGMTALEVIDSAGLAAAVVSSLPAERPGRRPAVTVPLDAAGARDDEEEHGEVLIAGIDSGRSLARDRAAVMTILHAPHPRAGQIAANARDPAGAVHRSSPVRWYDVEADGRYQVATSQRGDRLQISPADPRRLGHAIQQLFATVRAGG
ncbi:MAG: ESX secretion-associated protein EspG [Pseudonocardiaceae bacterium]